MAIDFSMPVLVVEDFCTMGRIISGFLKQIGFKNVDLAPGGSSALAKMRESGYGLVLSDWNMQPMTGLELLKHIRSEEALSKTRFIIMTAETSAENVMAAKRAGADGFISKPFTVQVLAQKVQQAFADANTPIT